MAAASRSARRLRTRECHPQPRRPTHQPQKQSARRASSAPVAAPCAREDLRAVLRPPEQHYLQCLSKSRPLSSHGQTQLQLMFPSRHSAGSKRGDLARRTPATPVQASPVVSAKVSRIYSTLCRSDTPTSDGRHHDAQPCGLNVRSRLADTCAGPPAAGWGAAQIRPRSLDTAAPNYRGHNPCRTCIRNCISMRRGNRAASHGCNIRSLV